MEKTSKVSRVQTAEEIKDFFLLFLSYFPSSFISFFKINKDTEHKRIVVVVVYEIYIFPLVYLFAARVVVD